MSIKSKLMLSLVLFSFVIITGNRIAFAETFAKTTANVSFREEPSQKSDIIKLVIANNEVQVLEEQQEWSKVQIDDYTGYIKNDFLEVLKEEVKSFDGNLVELLPWSQAKQIFTIGTPALIYDIYTGLSYEVKSFSNGLHADVETVTVEDTNAMKKTFGGRWDWDPRPVWVSINGRTMAASINGMPHGGGVNSSNGIDGQFCIHFEGSSTHNGNKSFARLHQNVMYDAFSLAENK